MSVVDHDDPAQRRQDESLLPEEERSLEGKLRQRHGWTVWQPGLTPGKRCVRSPKREGDPLRWRTVEDSDRHDPRNRTDGEGRR